MADQIAGGLNTGVLAPVADDPKEGNDPAAVGGRALGVATPPSEADWGAPIRAPKLGVVGGSFQVCTGQ